MSIVPSLVVLMAKDDKKKPVNRTQGSVSEQCLQLAMQGASGWLMEEVDKVLKGDADG